MDIGTEQGMKDAIQWTEQFLNMFFNNKGTWVVPRSEAVYHINKLEKTVSRETPDAAVDEVFKAMGWKVKNHEI